MLLLGSVHAISQPLYEDQVEDSADDPIAVQGLIERFNESAQLSPDSVESLLQKDADPKDPFFRLEFLEPYYNFKQKLLDKIGLGFGFDYTTVLLGATQSIGDDFSAGGMGRLYSSWQLIGRDTSSYSGSIIFKGENRHDYSNIPPSALGFEIGYAGIIEPPFSDQGWRLTNLYWRQSFGEDRFVTYIGFLDATDFVDAFILGSPWTGFFNFVFSTGSASIDLPNDATLGAMAGFWINEKIYIMGSLTDLSSDPEDPFGGFKTFFEDNEYFTSVEIGYTPSAERFFNDRIHLTFWHTDKRENLGLDDGWGFSFSATKWLSGDKIMCFIRGGYADDGAGLLEKSSSVGMGFQPMPGRDFLAVGINWGEPNEASFGPDLDSQFTMELMYRIQILRELAVTPDLQFIIDPANNPDDDFIAVFGIRARLAL
jgi:porin